MDEMADVAPAHNPPYIKAMKQLAERFPDVPLVTAFETDFHSTIPERNARYAVPTEWADQHLVRRWVSGASHRFVAEQLMKNMDSVPYMQFSAILVVQAASAGHVTATASAPQWG